MNFRQISDITEIVPKFNTNKNDCVIIPKKELREVDYFGGRI